MRRHLNLYDPSLRRQRQWLTLPNIAAAATGMLSLILVWGFLARGEADRREQGMRMAAEELSALQQETAALAGRIAGLKADPRLERELRETEARLAVRREILDWLGQSGEAPPGGAYADYLRGLARQTVDGVWLTSFTVGADGTGMEIRGRTLDPALLPEYIRRLNSERAFQGRRFAEFRISAAAAANSAGNGGAKPAEPVQSAIAGSAPNQAPNQAPARTFHEFALTPGAVDPTGRNRSAP